MKKLLILFSLAIFSQYAHAQSIGIGANTTPDASAVLDVNGTTKGFLPPRMLNTQRGAIGSPAPGLMVFQTNNGMTAPVSTAGLYVNTASGWKRIATSDEIVAGGSSSWTVSGVNQYNSLSGNVGLGTPTPGDKLDVFGNIRVSNDASNYIKFSNFGNAGNFIEFFNAGVEKGSIYQAAGNIGISTEGHSNHLRLYSSGLIATSSGTAFDIDGHGNTDPVLILDDDSPSLEFRDGLADRGFLSFIGQNMVLGTPASNTTGGLSFRTKNASRAYIDENGLFGIGTVSPEEKLHVEGNVIFEGTTEVPTTLSLRNGSTEKGFVQLSGENLRVGTFSGNNTGHFVVRTNGADHLEVDENGATTMKKLTVNKDLEAVHIEGNDPAINFFEAGVQRGYLWYVNNDVNLGTSNSAGKMFLNSSQINMQTAQVTIGTSIATPSTYKLGVGGRIICEELKVKLQSAGWPDYVFANNYKLKPLEEVENFIKINKHLPNIPSAQVIDKEGLEVGEMQRRMMEKIEELTLYIIDLKKEVDVLKANK
jgi:hypothetical protein